jgi:hypothetical protein
MARYAASSEPLDASQSWNSGVLHAGTHERITGLVFADQVGTLYIEQSSDGQNWDLSTDYAVTASDGKGFSEELVAPYARVRFVNGGTDQGAFRISIKTTAAGTR